MRVIDRIREVTSRYPDSIAVRWQGEDVTYSTFMQRVDGLAADLRQQGVGPISRVAIHLERSPELIVAIVATLAVGATYVPLDTESPTARLRQIVEDGDPAVLLADARSDLSGGLNIPCLDPVQWTREGAPVAAPRDGPAYLIYTSGSTGRPKGVVVGHESLENYLAWAIADLPFTGGGVPLFASVAFDFAITCYFPPLLMGEPLILLPPLRGGRDLAAGLLTGCRYSYVKITPSHFRMLDLDARAELGRSASLVIFGGERLTANLVADLRRDNPAVEVMNHYGPTEATVGCCIHRVPRGSVSDPIPIGRPLPGVQAQIRSPDSDVSAGDFGELLIGGRALAQGYWRSADLTRQRFVTTPGTNARENRWYRTGDVARYSADGEILYLGRADDQLKILGHRVEIAEIETALRAHADVREAFVFAAENSDATGVVAAVTTCTPTLSEEDLRTHVRTLLPSVMTPRRIVIVDKIPVNANGKLDRRSILQAIADDESSANQQTVEQIVARKFIEALAHPDIRLDDDFFELGGDSLATVEIAVWIREHFDIPLEPTALFEYPTIRALADHIRTFSVARSGPAVRADRGKRNVLHTLSSSNSITEPAQECEGGPRSALNADL